MKQQTFSYKKGQDVPSWVQCVTNQSDGNLYSGCGTIKFGSDGKLFVTQSGDVVTYPTKPRNRNSCFIKVMLMDNVILNGAGLGSNHCHYWTSCSIALRDFNLRNTVKTLPLPLTDPRS